jgi:hypothetical protein
MKSGCYSDQLGEFAFSIIGRVYLTGEMQADMSRPLYLVGINPATKRLQIVSFEGVNNSQNIEI